MPFMKKQFHNPALSWAKILSIQYHSATDNKKSDNYHHDHQKYHIKKNTVKESRYHKEQNYGKKLLWHVYENGIAAAPCQEEN